VLAPPDLLEGVEMLGIPNLGFRHWALGSDFHVWDLEGWFKEGCMGSKVQI
jgi:hypothetical protein